MPESGRMAITKIELYDLGSASPLPVFCRGGLSLLPGADASAFRASSPRLRLVRGVFGCASDRRGAAAQGRTGQYDGLDAGGPMVYLRLPAADRLSLWLLFRFVVRSASEFQSGRGALRCRMCRMARMGSYLGQTGPAGERSRTGPQHCPPHSTDSGSCNSRICISARSCGRNGR